MFKYIPINARFLKARSAMRKRFRLYMSPPEIVEDIWGRLSHEKIVQWSGMDDATLQKQRPLRERMIVRYGLSDAQNRYTLSDSDYSEDALNSYLHPNTITLWVMRCVRARAIEYFNAPEHS